MKITIVGTGYVGLVTGTCFAESGNDVICVDIDRKKVEMLRSGEVPIYEPGLTEMVVRNSKAGRLKFTTDLAEAMQGSRCLFIAVGTPPDESGAADMTAFWKVVDSLAENLPADCIVVVKSTVPVGTNRAVASRLHELTGRDCDVASNPEFLKEGCAIEDFTKPDRVVVGALRPEVADVLHQLYRPFLRTEKPFLTMGWESSEMTKYVANCLLATKISFINEMANLCDGVGADINEVRRGIGHDARIGFSFLFPGVGYGGSCFPKDVRALAAVAAAHDVKSRMLNSIDEVNQAQKRVLFEKMSRHFSGDFQGRTIAIWGLAFKPRTDDIREAPALTLIGQLLEAGAQIRVNDPVAMPNVRQLYGDKLTYCEDQYEACTGAEALAISTEWNEFRNPDFERIKTNLKQPVIFDGRNLFDPVKMHTFGFRYEGIGLRQN